MQKDTIIHTINSITLDPTGGNHPYTIHDITSTVVKRTGPGNQRLSGYRTSGYDGGSSGQLYRSSRLLGDWILLCPSTGAKDILFPALFPAERNGKTIILQSSNRTQRDLPNPYRYPTAAVRRQLQKIPEQIAPAVPAARKQKGKIFSKGTCSTAYVPQVFLRRGFPAAVPQGKGNVLHPLFVLIFFI